MLGRRKQINLTNAEKKCKKQWQLELENQKEENQLLNGNITHTQDNGTIEDEKFLELYKEPIDNLNTHSSTSENLTTHTPTENISDKQINNSLKKLEAATDEGNTSKRKRFEWMDSDDEDIGSSSEEEEQEQIDDTELTHNSEDDTHFHKEDESAHTHTTPRLDEATNNNEIINPDEMKYAYVSNVSWDATVKELLNFIEKQSGQEVVTIHTEFALASGTISNFKTSNIGKHKGRVIIELKTYQSLPDVLRLNEHPFMGRPLRITKAYKKEGIYHFGTKFFSSRNVLNASSAHKSNKKVKMDGGFNWAS